MNSITAEEQPSVGHQLLHQTMSLNCDCKHPISNKRSAGSVPAGVLHSIQDEITEQQPPPVKRPEYLWKLTKGKFVLLFRLCNLCQNRLYNSEDKTVRNGEFVDVKFSLCQECVVANIRATDILAPFKKRE
ncbi:hypothetical protein niasHT_022172 [Heterodera trifolii]|uniref:Uncharacterized protein n=1 Tax=Heterodera trifolii TaxID=157864 RepID=A0ABD2KP98_9BILA